MGFVCANPTFLRSTTIDLAQTNPLAREGGRVVAVHVEAAA